MAPKFSIDRHERHRTTISEWHRNNIEWVRHTFHEWMQRRVAPLADASILDPNSAACTIRPPHTRRTCMLMQAETERAAMRQSTRFFHCLFLDLFFEIHHVKNFEFSELLRKLLSSFVQDSFCGDPLLSWKSCPSLQLTEKLFDHLPLVIFHCSHS